MKIPVTHGIFQVRSPGAGGRDFAYERGGDAGRKFKEDRSGRGPSFFWPLKETMLKHRQYIYFYIFRVEL